jgi:addiction module HigA family antidote
MKNKEIQIDELWNNEKKDELKKFILAHSKVQSEERQLANQLLAIQYRIEDYIQNDDDNGEVLKILDFVKMYLKTLNVSQKSLANLFEMKDSNLHKYLVGDRKLSNEMALKLSSFSHTKPEYWYRIQVKNELLALKKELSDIDYYKKFDYKNLIEV